MWLIWVHKVCRLLDHDESYRYTCGHQLTQTINGNNLIGYFFLKMLWTYELCIRCYSLLHLWKQTPNEQCSFIYQNVLLLSTDKCAFLSNAINMCTCYFTLWLSNRLPYLPKKIFMHSVHHTIIFITKTVCASEAVYTVFMFIIILHY